MSEFFDESYLKTYGDTNPEIFAKKLNDHFDFVPYNIKNKTYAIKHRPRIETTSSA